MARDGIGSLPRMRLQLARQCKVILGVSTLVILGEAYIEIKRLRKCIFRLYYLTIIRKID